MARSGSEDLLDPHQIDELLQRYRLTGDRSLRNRVVEAHLDIAGFQVRRFARSGSASVEDLRQTALVAVINAAERYEAGHGASFRTFASRTIEGELKRYLRDRSWAVRPPRGRQEMYLHVRRCTEDLSHELHRSPTVAEVADRLGVSEEAVLEGMEAGNAREAEHIDPVVRPDDRPSGGHPLGVDRPGLRGVRVPHRPPRPPSPAWTSGSGWCSTCATSTRCPSLRSPSGWASPSPTCPGSSAVR